MSSTAPNMRGATAAALRRVMSRVWSMKRRQQMPTSWLCDIAPVIQRLRPGPTPALVNLAPAQISCGRPHFSHQGTDVGLIPDKDHRTGAVEHAGVHTPFGAVDSGGIQLRCRGQLGWATHRRRLLRIGCCREKQQRDRKSTRLNSSHVKISYAVFCLKKKNRRDSQ